MSRRAVVNDQTLIVENVIELEDDADWPIPEGRIIVDAPDSGSIGDVWDGEYFVPPQEEKLEEGDLRLGELISKLKRDTMTLKEIREFLRAMYGLDKDES